MSAIKDLLTSTESRKQFLKSISQYSADFNKKNCWICCCIVFIYLFFIQPVEAFSAKYIVAVLSHFRHDTTASILSVAVTATILLFCIVKYVRKRLVPTINSVTRVLTVAGLYIFLIRPSGAFTFYRAWNSGLYFTDLLALLICLAVMRLRRYSFQNNKTGTAGFIIDEPVRSSANTDPANFANEVISKLLATDSDKAFAVAIIAEWGKGKTSFLYQLESALHQRNELVISFNPWKNEGARKNILHFFDELRDKLKPFDTAIAGEINSYVSKLVSTYNNKLFQVIDDSFAISQSDQSLSRQYQQLNRILKVIGKKIFVFVDDLDRLTPQEIIEVLTLIRNTADFRNVYFIVAFDNNYVLNSIGKNFVFNKKEDFLQKIFQLEIVLTPIPRGLIRKELRYYLGIDSMPPDEQLRFREAFNELSIVEDKDQVSVILNKHSGGLLEEFLQTIRDVKRFSNSFLLAYKRVGSAVELVDLLVLELIKYRCVSLYNLLASKSILTLTNPVKGRSLLRLRDNAITNKGDDWWLGLNIDPSRSEAIGTALSMVFKSRNTRSERSVVYPLNFQIYFNYELGDLETIRKFSEIRNSSAKSIAELTIHLEADDKLAEFLANTRDTVLSDEGNFENLFTALFLSSREENRTAIEETLLQIMIAQDQVVRLHYNNVTENYYKFVYSLLEDKNLDPILRSAVAFSYLNTILTNQRLSNNLFEEYRLKDIIYECFKTYYNSKPALNRHTLNLYAQNFETVDPMTRGVTISNRANDFMYFVIKRQPIEYLKFFLRVSQEAEEKFTGDPHIPAIFGGWENFIEWLSGLADTDFYVMEAKTFMYYFSDARYSAVRFRRGTIEIVSDPTTRFEHSPDYPHLPGPVTSTICRHERKINITRDIPALKFAEWIAHAEEITKEERIRGGRYVFSKEFSFGKYAVNIKSARLFLLVDDVAEIYINGGNAKIFKDFTANPPHQLDLVFQDDNRVDFTIINTPMDAARIDKNPGFNPYEFIYKIVINVDYESLRAKE